MTPPCGVPFRGGLEHAVLHHPGLEKFFDQIENVAVGDLAPQRRHDDVVGKVVEEPLDVGIEYVRVPVPMEFQDFFHGHVTVAAGPEPVRVVMKHPIEDRTQEKPKHLLSNAVADGRDPQGPGLPRSLGDLHAPQGQGGKLPFLQATHQGQQVLLEVGLEHGDADLVDPRRTAVTFDVAEGISQGSLVDDAPSANVP